jgi:hypothetical protein
MQPTSIIVWGLALCLSCRAPVPASDGGFGELLRSMVTDSLVGGGRRPGQRYVPADAASDSLLRATGLVLTPPSETRKLACPSSTDTAGEPVTSDVGYVVRIDRTEQAQGVVLLDLTVSCAFIFRGEPRGFAQGSTWELRQIGGRWRVTRTLDRRIT